VEDVDVSTMDTSEDSRASVEKISDRTASEEAIGCEATRERSRSRKSDQP
jgi:hypothetical protein